MGQPVRPSRCEGAVWPGGEAGHKKEPPGFFFRLSSSPKIELMSELPRSISTDMLFTMPYRLDVWRANDSEKAQLARRSGYLRREPPHRVQAYWGGSTGTAG